MLGGKVAVFGQQMRDRFAHHLADQLDVVLHSGTVVFAIPLQRAHELSGRHRMVDVERQYLQISQRQVRDGLLDLKLRCHDRREVQRTRPL
ncbi:hypothetical protein [Pseudacidovorax intermedius]|uniref:hypothetical protein n=1 Tax=Pseudacidovorax intermedius TaxID=433924 RepID=UPI0012DDCE74|nr:hypothetical protein [Pseudacidovorax intermedius]